jgi:CBS-domain-containing membrane protein
MKNYFAKMKGKGRSPHKISLSEIFWSWLGGFIGISLIAWLSAKGGIAGPGKLFLIGSFGASAVLIYGAPHVEYAQPRNLVGGHVLSALVGVLIAHYAGLPLEIAGPLAVASSIALMHMTKTIHPPGGATALIAILGGAKIKALGFLYAIFPVGLGATLMLLVALIVNNLAPTRSYPKFWR